MWVSRSLVCCWLFPTDLPGPGFNMFVCDLDMEIEDQRDSWLVLYGTWDAGTPETCSGTCWDCGMAQFPLEPMVCKTSFYRICRSLDPWKWLNEFWANYVSRDSKLNCFCWNIDLTLARYNFFFFFSFHLSRFDRWFFSDKTINALLKKSLDPVLESCKPKIVGKQKFFFSVFLSQEAFTNRITINYVINQIDCILWETKLHIELTAIRNIYYQKTRTLSSELLFTFRFLSI